MQLYDSYHAVQAADLPADYNSVGGAICYQNMHLAAAEAIGQITDGVTHSPQIAAAASFIALPYEALNHKASIIPRAAELQALRTQALQDGTWPKGRLDTVRIIGSGRLITEALRMQNAYVKDESRGTAISSLQNINTRGALANYLKLLQQPFAQILYTGLLRKGFAFDPLLDAGSYQFSDPIHSPLEMPQSEAQGNTGIRTELLSSMAARLPFGYFGREIESCDHLRGLSFIPENGIIASRDSVQELATLDRPVNGVVINHLEPGMFMDGTEFIPRMGEFKACLIGFADNVLSQILPGGHLFLTIGRGNQIPEFFHRVATLVGIEKALRSMGASVTVLRAGPSGEQVPMNGILGSAAMTEWQVNYWHTAVSYGLLSAKLPEQTRKGNVAGFKDALTSNLLGETFIEGYERIMAAEKDLSRALDGCLKGSAE